MSMSLGNEIINRFKQLTSSQSQKIQNSTPENWHEDFIVHLAKILKPNRYVELGLYKCELFNRIVPYAGELIGVDIDRKSGTYMEKSPKTKFLCMTTQQAALEIKDANTAIDFLFIDADHSYQAVKSDFGTYFPMVSDQGIIIFHDAYPKNKKYASPEYCGDGYRAIWELSKISREFELVTIPVHPGLAICRKRNKQLAWK